MSGIAGDIVDVQILLREIRGMRRELQQLTSIVNRDKIYDTWIDEATAAQMLGLAPRVLRRKVKAQEIPIDYRNTAGRNYQYNRRGLKKYLDETSTAG